MPMVDVKVISEPNVDRTNVAGRRASRNLERISTPGLSAEREVMGGQVAEGNEFCGEMRVK